ncbi:MAG: hypothetical protein N3B21_10820 [Clostridia bacterium]|nr:hypothetical protein [Clostridia bacterium]
MKQNVHDLERQIRQKNHILSSITHDESNNETIRLIKSELDSLLYQYYKLLKCG